MMRWVILAGLVVAITAAAVMFQSSSADSTPHDRVAFPVAPPKASGPQPKFTIDGDLTYHFDIKAQHTSFEREWTVKNDGDAKLELDLQAPSCVCTVAYLAKEGQKKANVPPHGQVTLHLTWNTKETNGKYSKDVSLLTNDPERPTIVIKAEGTVMPAVVVSEDPVELLELSTDEESHTHYVAIYSADRPELKLTKLSSSKPGLIELDDQPFTEEDCKFFKAKKGHRVKITVKRGMPLGVFREEAILKTDDSRRAEIRLILTGRMVGPITVLPQRLDLKNVSSSNGTHVSLALLVRGGREVKFEVAHKPANFKVDVNPGKSDSKLSRYEVYVTIPPGTPAGDVEDMIVLKTDHSHAPEIRIPVSVLISDRG